MHLQTIEQYLRPNVRYLLKSERDGFVNICMVNSFFGLDGKRHVLALARKNVLSKETKIEPLNVVHNSDRSLSFNSTNIGKWLRKRTNFDHVFFDERIEDAAKFEPLIDLDESDGIVLRTVQFWDNLCVRHTFSGSWVMASKDMSTKFAFIAAD